MFKKGDTAYFVFQGDFVEGRYKDFFCLPSTLIYFPFYPILITDSRVISRLGLPSIQVTIGRHASWHMPIDLIEKEFSLNKFIVAKMLWGGTMSQGQFKSIIATL